MPESVPQEQEAVAPAKPSAKLPFKGLIVAGVVLAGAAGLTFFALKMLSTDVLMVEKGDPRKDEVVTVEIGDFPRDIPTEQPGRVEQFMITVALRLNPKYGDLAQLKSEVEKRIAVLKDRVNNEVIYKLSIEQFRNPPSVLIDRIKRGIKAEVDKILPSNPKGQEAVLEVLIPKCTLPGPS